MPQLPVLREHAKPLKTHDSPKHAQSKINHEQPESRNEEPKGSWRSWRRGEGLEGWENEIANSSEVRRKANVAQLCTYTFTRFSVKAPYVCPVQP